MGQSLAQGYDLIITNGDSAGELLRKAVTNTEVLPWRDVLHDGPVPLTEDHDELSELRADVLADKGWGEHDELRENFSARDRGLANNAIFENVILWFEHDLYDQLQLIQLLSWFSDNPRPDGELQLVQADDFLGHQTAETILRFEEKRKPVSREQMALASKAWEAFRQPTPERWENLLNDDLTLLPYLRPAVLRMLEELPSARDGLSRTQREILITVNEGVREPRHIFPVVQHQEEAAFMGDWSFFERLDGLALGNAPLLEGLDERFLPGMNAQEIRGYLESDISLSDFGFQVLGGGEDYAGRARIDFWIGGTHITNDTLWRWDRDNAQLIAPA